jgi:O-antigen/teichoic acid export membrane protein
MLTGTIIAQAINIGVTLIITRIYSTESYGEFSLFFSISSFLGFIAAGGFEYLIPKQKDKSSAEGLFYLSLILALITAFGVLAGLVLIHLFVGLESVYYFLPLSVLSSSFFLTLNLEFTSRKAFGTISKNKIGQSVWVSTLQISLSYLSKSAGLIIGLTLGRIFNILFFLIHFFRKHRLSGLSTLTRNKLISILRRNWKLGAGITQSHIFSRGALEAPIILISIIFNEAILRLYALSYRVLTLPVSLIANSVEQVIYKEVAERLIEGKQVIRLILKNWGYLFSISIIPATVLMIWGEEIFAFLFGTEWAESGKIAKILAPLIILNLLNASTGRLYFLIDRVNIPLFFSALNFFLILISFLIGYLNKNFYQAITLMVLLRSISVICFNALLILTFRKISSDEH